MLNGIWPIRVGLGSPGDLLISGIWEASGSGTSGCLGCQYWPGVTTSLRTRALRPGASRGPGLTKPFDPTGTAAGGGLFFMSCKYRQIEMEIHPLTHVNRWSHSPAKL